MVRNTLSHAELCQAIFVQAPVTSGGDGDPTTTKPLILLRQLILDKITV